MTHALLADCSARPAWPGSTHATERSRVADRFCCWTIPAFAKIELTFGSL